MRSKAIFGRSAYYPSSLYAHLSTLSNLSPAASFVLRDSVTPVRTLFLFYPQARFGTRRDRNNPAPPTSRSRFGPSRTLFLFSDFPLRLLGALCGSISFMRIETTGVAATSKSALRPGRRGKTSQKGGRPNLLSSFPCTSVSSAVQKILLCELCGSARHLLPFMVCLQTSATKFTKHTKRPEQARVTKFQLPRWSRWKRTLPCSNLMLL